MCVVAVVGVCVVAVVGVCVVAVVGVVHVCVAAVLHVWGRSRGRCSASVEFNCNVEL